MLRRKHITISVLLAICIILSLWFVHSSIPVVKAVSLNHPSINIDGNAALDAFCAGNGTFGNSTHPHVIENFEIYSDGAQNGFKIANTDLYLIIHNVNVTEFFQSTDNRGLYLLNCEHITVQNCHFYNNSYGIVWENTNNSRIADTSGSINRVLGITFENCHNNTLYNVVAFENGLKQNEGNGMDLISSNNNTIDYCIFLENWGHGLLLQDSFYNIVFDTQFLYNHGECFVVLNDPEATNIFYDNSCRNRLVPGAPIGIIALISLSTITGLVILTIHNKKKTQTA